MWQGWCLSTTPVDGGQTIDLVFTLTLPVTFAAYDTCRLRKAFDWEAVAEKAPKLLHLSSEGNNQLFHLRLLMSRIFSGLCPCRYKPDDEFEKGLYWDSKDR